MKSNNEFDICFLGDTYYGEWHMQRRENNNLPNLLKQRGYLDFAKNFKTFLNSCDFVVANLECAITDRPKTSFAKEKVHVYAGSKETLKALKDVNVGLVTMANNHAGDFGKEGTIDTINALKEYGIDYVGAGFNEKEASTPYIIKDKKLDDLQLAIISAYNLNARNQKYGFYADQNSAGVNILNTDIVEDTFREIKNNHKNTLTIFSPHWGDNFVWKPHNNRQRAKRLFARNKNCDLIIGHSAHMMQEVEYINSKLVLYSIGNFILNGGGDEYKNRNLPPYSFIVRLNIFKEDNRTKRRLMIYPIVCDNSATDFNPRFVTKDEFEHVYMILKSLRYDFKSLDKQCKKNIDLHGYYIEFNI